MNHLFPIFLPFLHYLVFCNCLLLFCNSYCNPTSLNSTNLLLFIIFYYCWCFKSLRFVPIPSLDVWKTHDNIIKLLVLSYFVDYDHLTPTSHPFIGEQHLGSLLSLWWFTPIFINLEWRYSLEYLWFEVSWKWRISTCRNYYSECQLHENTNNLIIECEGDWSVWIH